MWPDVKIVHGKARHSQSQGSVERANQDIENMLSTWMETNQLSKWSEGLRFIQAMKNRAYHEGNKCSPYEAMFGCPMKMGLATSAIHSNMIRVIRFEEDLEKLLHSHDNMEQNNDVENAIEQDNEESIVENESEGVKLKVKKDFSYIAVPPLSLQCFAVISELFFMGSLPLTSLIVSPAEPAMGMKKHS
ncbi:KRAB-A domain-containing protein 2-like [Centruroides sculpturatus]|uniref:KRAB-A domain-containing protein 2-like n=1 Tax=Centruroides sculpturatus TaxID=218467 RepID=UPI000C6DDB4D|nr:KRAB-A domain-containing protein 2-like [Centruroides sculpturatus]